MKSNYSLRSVSLGRQWRVRSLIKEDYGQDKHTVEIGATGQDATLKSDKLSLYFSATIDSKDDATPGPELKLQKAPCKNHLGDGITAQFRLQEGQSISFILRDHEDQEGVDVTRTTLDEVQKTTHKFWSRWIAQSKYKGRWEDVVTRSLFILKMLTFEPTGAIVAAPTFSLPEDFGGKHSNPCHVYCV